jgi:redox-sensing transcriptional repressor
MRIPEPTVERLLQLSRVLENLKAESISSSEIEAKTGWSSYTIRKDISFLQENLGEASGYNRLSLLAAIKRALALGTPWKFCVVGLGRLGSAYLNFPAFADEGFELVAGFDSSVNRIEILRSPVPLYPAYKMGEVISRFSIDLALLCVPAASAQGAADKLVASGIRGIINFAPVVLEVPERVMTSNVFVVDELRSMAAKLACLVD